MAIDEGKTRRTGSTIETGTLCSFKALATTSIVEADANMPECHKRCQKTLLLKHKVDSLDASEMRSTADHTCFDDINADVLNAGVNLLADKRGRRVVDVIDALCVLRRQCRRRRHGIAAVCRNHFLVGLEATEQQRVRAAATVAPRRKSHFGQ